MIGLFTLTLKTILLSWRFYCEAGRLLVARVPIIDRFLPFGQSGRKREPVPLATSCGYSDITPTCVDAGRAELKLWLTQRLIAIIERVNSAFD